VKLTATAFALAAFALPIAAQAAGNLASQPTRLDPLALGDDLSMSVTEYHLETGKYYNWKITAEGGEEFLVMAPELFRSSWINQIVINDLEVKPMGGIYGVEFDDAGEIDVWFVPIQPGNYEFWVDGQRERGMVGTFVVR
jgi:uncharacterized cupredoxin-like copper-binding protein